MTAPAPTIPTPLNALAAVEFTPPLINPAPGGLFAAVSWQEFDSEAEPLRWLPSGIQFRTGVTGNFPGDDSSGVWGAEWCAGPDDLGPEDVKDGTRPEDQPPFTALTVWAYDACDLTAPSQAEVRDRALQALRMTEQRLVARSFAERLDADAVVAAEADLVTAVAALEAEFAEANTTGVVHASPKLTAQAVAALVLSRSGGTWRTPSGHLWLAEAGYRPVLGDSTLIGTSALFGWRDQPALRTVEDAEGGEFIAIAERSYALGYEALVAAVSFGGKP